MIINKKRLGRGGFVIGAAGTLAVLATGLIPVAAQVIGDPLGLISIGTSGESTSGSVLAVSNGGNASGGTNGAGVSTSGTATGGLVAASGTGCAVTGNTYAYAPVAVSGTGCAGGQGTTVSGTGTACGSGLVGVSAANTSCGFVSVSGDGPASGTYGVDGWGDVTAEGNSVNGSNLATNINGQAMEEAGVAYHPVDDQVQWVGWEPPADVVQAKETQLASVEPVVVQMLAECAAGCAATAANIASNQPPRSLSVGVPQTHQNTNYTCGPSSTRIAVWAVTGTDPGEGTAESYSNGRWGGGSGLAREENDHVGDGTAAGAVAHTAYSHVPQTGYEWEAKTKHSADLMSIVVTDMYYGSPKGATYVPVILDMSPNPNGRSDADTDQSYMKYWSGHTSDGHYTIIHGYDTRNAGQLEIFDEFDPGYGAGRAPYGDHWVPLQMTYNVEAGVVW
jgi:hypothetical protein